MLSKMKISKRFPTYKVLFVLVLIVFAVVVGAMAFPGGMAWLLGGLGGIGASFVGFLFWLATAQFFTGIVLVSVTAVAILWFTKYRAKTAYIQQSPLASSNPVPLMGNLPSAVFPTNDPTVKVEAATS